MTVRVLTPGEYVAELLEAEADRIPRSMKERADILREHARLMRKRGGPKRVRLWEIKD
jgi:hypothetical protein